VTDREATSRRRPLGPVILGVLATAVLLCVLARLLDSPDAPVAVRRLFVPGEPLATAAIVIGAVLWLGLAASVLGLALLKRPRLGLGLPLWVAIAGVVAAAAFSLALVPSPAERLWTGRGLEQTLLFSYVALVLALASGVVAGVRLVRAGEASSYVFFVLLLGVPWVVLAHGVLAGWLTDGALPGPIRTSPVPGHVVLAALVGLMGLNGAGLGYAVWRFRPVSVAVGLIVTLALAGAGYVLLRLGLEPEVLTADGLRAPYRMLLAGAWEVDVSPSALLARWMAVQTGAVVLVAVGHLAGLRLAEAIGAVARPGDDAEREAATRPEKAAPGRPAGAVPAPAHPGRAYAVITVVYGVLIVYGLLIPLDFQPRPFEEALQAFSHTPYLTLGASHRADLVANLLLFIPLTFAAMGWLTRENERDGLGLIGLLVVGGASVLAVGVEFAQVWFPPRTVSLNDILAECAGASVGVGLWLAVGGGITAWWRRLRALTRPADVARHLAAAYLVGLALYQLFPFDVVLSVQEMASRWEHGRIVLMPFADWARTSSLMLAAKTLIYVPVGYGLVVRRPAVRGPVTVALVVGGAYALGLEVFQVFMYTRYASATDVVLGAAGSAVGGMLATRFGPAARRPLPAGWAWRGFGWTVRLAMFAAVAGALVWGKWQPFDLTWPPEGVAAALAGRIQVPFVAQYWNSEFEATAQLLRDILSAGVVGLLLVSLVPRAVPGRRGVSAVVAGAMVAAIEMAQILFPPHSADMTTAVLAAGGAAAGVYLYEPFVRCFIRPGAEAPQTEGPEQPT